MALTRTYISIILTLIWTCADAQRAVFSPFIGKLQKLPVELYQETIFIHIDRSSYLTGETMWLKAYLVNSGTHQLTEVSKVAYLEILNADRLPVIQTKIELVNGMGSGNVFIPSSLNSGHYLVRSYTQWMKNFSPDFFYHQNITVINPFRKIQENEKEKGSTIDVQFFPEGGYLVSGLINTVAVRAVYSNGRGAGFKGVLVGHGRDTLARFHSLKFGMGSFSFIPQNGEAYQAYIQAESKAWQPVPFLRAVPEGIILHVEDTMSNLAVQVHTQGGIQGPFMMVVHCRNQTRIIRFFGLQQRAQQILISKDSLGDGINHLTVFDSNLRPMCERLYFKRPDRILQLTSNFSSQEVNTRTRIKFDVSVSEGLKKAGKAQLSVSAALLDSLGVHTLQTIDQYLLLSSDLRGVVESPEYYFSNAGKERDEALDLVMMTHGWSRYSWDQIVSNSKVIHAFPPEYRGHIIRGTVHSRSGVPSAGVTTLLASPGKSVRVYPSVSNTRGEVFFEMKSFYGPRKIILQSAVGTDSLYAFKIDSAFSDKKYMHATPPFELSPTLEKNLVARSIAMQTVSIYSPTPASRNTSADSSSFYGQPDERYILDDYTRFPLLEEVLREYVAGIWVRKRGKVFSFHMPDNVDGKMLEGRPLVLLDGVPVFSINRLMAVDPLRIKEIAVIGKKYFLQGTSWSGIASFKTYQADLGGYQLSPHALVLDYEGLQLKKEFYSPKYDTPAMMESRLPDRRTLLLWKPDLTTDPDGKVNIEFYTSDVRGNYQVIIQGISENGTPGSNRINFMVR